MSAEKRPQESELVQAFSLFNEVSGSLIQSYEQLQDKVARLGDELARARAEQAQELAAKERLAERLSQLLESLPGGVIVLGADGVVQECNPAAEALLGEPLKGKLWRDLAFRAFTPRPDDGHDITLASGRRVNLSTCSLGNQPGQILLLNDVTETRRLQTELAHLERLSAMGRMAAALAHQIRTPLSAALLYAGTLAGQRVDDARRRDYGAKLKGVLGDLEKLVRDMLAFARTGEFAVEELDARDLYQALEPLARRVAEVGGARFAADFGAAGATVQANQDALGSVLENLVHNAVNAGGEGVGVSLSFALADGHLEVRVGDDGPGMAPELAARAFEPFVTTRSAGTGLGLAIARSVMRAHGGAITLDTAPGAGARFTLRLPLAHPGVTPAGLEGTP